MPEEEASPFSVLLLDIEGTTTPIDFVYEVLFPYARENLKRFLEDHFAESETAAAVRLLAGDHAAEVDSGTNPPPWQPSAALVATFCQWLMDADRKATGLKAIQGLIWRNGYEDGSLKATLYDDVVPAFDRWTERGAEIYIYSSGSVLAQKLLFAHTTFGDTTPCLSGYFDTETGPKNAADSYRKISNSIGRAPRDVLFLSDSVGELEAAEAAGMATGLVARGESAAPPENPRDHPVLSDFSGIA